MTRPSFLYRPNVAKAAHSKARGLLQSVPCGQKNDFITDAVLHFSDEKRLEEKLRQIVHDELAHVSLSQTQEQAENKIEIPAQMMNFVDSLFADET